MNHAAATRLEPALTRVFLPGCRGCGHRHPLAMTPAPADLSSCPGCGAAVAAPGPAQVEPAVVTGWAPWAVAARAAFAIGRLFALLAKAILPRHRRDR